MTKNVVFDIGGVLIGFRWKEMMMDHGLSGEEADSFARRVFDDPLWLEFDYGNIPYEEVRERYVRLLPDLEEPIRYFLGHPELMPVPRPAVWEKGHALKQAGYRIYLLSNYSDVFLQAHVGGAPFWKDVDGEIISCRVHVIKPDSAIYRCLLDRYQLKPEECVFLDDREVNVEGARKLGMKGVRVDSQEQLLEVLEGLLELQVDLRRP